jgi:hypothetical protein
LNADRAPQLKASVRLSVSEYKKKVSTPTTKEIVDMKLTQASATCLLFVLCQVAVGQEAKKVQEPDYLGVFFSLDSNTGNLSPLERQTPEAKWKSGLGGVESSLEFKGERSPVRFKQGQRLEFVVLVSSQQMDPQGLVQFLSLEAKKGKRRLVTGKSALFGGKTSISEKAIAFNAAKYGTSSFKITPAQNLPPGEYTLSQPDTDDGFCFGIDATNQRLAESLPRPPNNGLQRTRR